MAIDKSIAQAPTRTDSTVTEEELRGLDVDAEGSALEVAVVNPEAVAISTDDGGVVIDFDPGSGETGGDDGFDSNLAEHMEDTVLGRLASQLNGEFEGDRNSRADWARTYTRGLDLLGLKADDRTTPWPGACGVYHPILTEAVVRFQSQAIMELFPASGPVKTKIIGEITDQKEEQAQRIQQHMNYLLTEKMTEFRPETEQMLFSLPLAGSSFKKVYYDPNMGRVCSHFVPAEDFVVSYGASDLLTASRYTHMMRKSHNDIRKLQVAGLYRDIELSPNAPDYSDIQEKYDELEGENPTYEHDDRYVLLEMHVDLDLEGYEDTDDDGDETGIALPYVVTMVKGGSSVLSIRRNWYEDDALRMKRLHFVHYQYMPGLGFYGFGLIHLIGGIAKSATSLLRQLVDAGTLSNLPGGLKSRGLRIKGDDSPIMPGEFRDVDVPGGAIRDNITFLPYKEPSNVLHALLGEIVEEGRRFASITDLKLADMKQDAPVGTTLALIERSMKVMSAIQARLHDAMRKEFTLIAGIVRDYAEDEYEYKADDKEAIKGDDFDGRVDVIPVSDPNAATMSQRIMQYQAALQLSQSAPQMYDLPELHRQMLDVLGIQDAEKIIPLSEEMKPRDPVSENMDVLNGKPLKAFIYQDHEAHIQVHMAAIQDPKIQQLVSQSPMAGTIAAAMSSHIQEHLGFQYRREIEKQLGVELPPPNEPLPEDIEVKLSRLVAEAAERLFNKNVAEAQQQQAQQQAQDPMFQLQQKELELRQADIQRKAETDRARLMLNAEKERSSQELERDKMAQDAELEGVKLGIEIAKTQDNAALKVSEAEERAVLERARLSTEVAKALLDDDTKRNRNS
ncbi:MAG: hypothetical protein QF437_02945 [Planctomycetota bacterium]|jgi:hypothetical protein|nr:hypothetical protein [Planctomycetota bacterium]MDP7129414.1 hypothetical protein [Planctomycetota bacterium]MDP7286850.1 hypothetical protein [Phycisphaerae bacterium]|tara:strand:- start:1533 stop:4073 length:2541 start_codon:yes stop_codon:yes gene_type:complete